MSEHARRIPRHRRGRSACPVRSPSSGRSGSRAEDRRASPGGAGASRPRRRAADGACAEALRDVATRVQGATSDQGRDHRASWRSDSGNSGQIGSSSSLRISTTGCSRSARRWRPGAGPGRASSSSPCSRATRVRSARRRLGQAGRLRDRGRVGSRAPRGGPPCLRRAGRDPGVAPVRERRLRASRRRGAVRGRRPQSTARSRPRSGTSTQPPRPRVARARWCHGRRGGVGLRRAAVHPERA